jgi:predicted nucleotidyltransferase
VCTGTEIRCQLITKAELAGIEAAAKDVLPRFPWVKAAYLYGSAARGDRPARDVDIGLWADPIPRWGEEARVASELQQACPVIEVDWDVRCLNGGDPVFLRRVLCEGQRIFEADQEARIWFEAHAISQWLDFQPVWERLRTEVLERWGRV